MMKITNRKATIPPNLLGIHREITYSHKKYHSD